jgi:hypothetical protein
VRVEAVPAQADAEAGMSMPAGTARQSPDDAWWTEPLLASTAATLPQGHFYIEPYIYDSIPYTRLSGAGGGHSVPREDDFGSQTYLNYGLTDRLTVGVIPRFGYSWLADGGSSAGPRAADPTIQAQYRVTQFHPGSWVPTFSINLQETLPLGRYDRLQRPTDGFGSGSYTTTLSTYFQTLFWMPDGRILRTRLDFSYALPSRVSIDGASVYGTAAGFRGYAHPGDSVYCDVAFEYSATRSWVLALDLWLQRAGSTRVEGSDPNSTVGTVSFSSLPGRELFVAPALEYNWSSRVGVIVGVRVMAAGSNVTATVTPVAAFSYFL